MLLNYNQGTTIVDTKYAAFSKNELAASSTLGLHYHFIFRANADLDTLETSIAARKKIYRFLANCVEVLQGSVEAIGGKNEQIHLLVTLDLAHNPADFARRIKLMSTAWAKRHLSANDFAWFEEEISTVSHSQCNYLSSYIERQSKTFLRKKAYRAH
jgi:REP element-mobilizing transposase RayT